VVTARVYSRKRSDSEREEVDFFLVRSLDGSSEHCDDAKLRAIERLTRALLAGEIEVGALAKHAAETSPPTEPPSTNVYFSRSSRDRLVVEAEDRSGLLLTITLALHRAGVSVLRSEVTTFAGVARDEFMLAEPSGDPLDEERRTAVVRAVLSALDPE
jgi:UTP:GlnB (protein PII) uridylyltransferase